LAEAAGISANTVTRFESGKNANASTPRLIRGRRSKVHR
jgi:transcriptional regulator with XRE-family HTH domain